LSGSLLAPLLKKNAPQTRTSMMVELVGLSWNRSEKHLWVNLKNFFRLKRKAKEKNLFILVFVHLVFKDLFVNHKMNEPKSK
jgi:hypothetical protein